MKTRSLSASWLLSSLMKMGLLFTSRGAPLARWQRQRERKRSHRTFARRASAVRRPRFGAPRPCSKLTKQTWLTYPQHDQLVRLCGARWARDAERLFDVGFDALLALAQKPA